MPLYRARDSIYPTSSSTYCLGEAFESVSFYSYCRRSHSVSLRTLHTHSDMSFAKLFCSQIYEGKWNCDTNIWLCRVFGGLLELFHLSFSAKANCGTMQQWSQDCESYMFALMAIEQAKFWRYLSISKNCIHCTILNSVEIAIESIVLLKLRACFHLGFSFL